MTGVYVYSGIHIHLSQVKQDLFYFFSILKAIIEFSIIFFSGKAAQTPSQRESLPKRTTSYGEGRQ